MGFDLLPHIIGIHNSLNFQSIFSVSAVGWNIKQSIRKKFVKYIVKNISNLVNSTKRKEV